MRKKSPSRPPALARSWSWLGDSGWALREIGHGVVRPALPPSYADGMLIPVLVIPGVFENWTMLRRLCDRVNAAGNPVHVLPELIRNTMPIAQGTAIAERYLRSSGLDAVAVLAHSKGGLIGKQLMARNEAQVAHLIAIATPFGGSPYARFVPHPVISGFRPEDRLLADLARQQVLHERITTISSVFDPYIPSGSALEGAHNLQVASHGHFRILGDPEVAGLVLQALAGIHTEQ